MSKPIFTPEAIAAGLPGVGFTDRHCPGFRPLREGESWHRPDFTPDMLPPGWRPLLTGENTRDVDQFRMSGSWVAADNNQGPRNAGLPRNRTQRPLPE